VAGPFLSMPVLLKVLPQGLDAHDPDHVRSLRLAYEEWEENRDNPRPKAADLPRCDGDGGNRKNPGSLGGATGFGLGQCNFTGVELL
jgi:hypothetical protein